MLGAGKEGGRATGNSNEEETERKNTGTQWGGGRVKTDTHRQRAENGEKRGCGEREHPRGVCRVRGLDLHHRELS